LNGKLSPADLRRFDELGDRWARGRLTLQEFADEIESPGADG
jgi:hypothetical protein